MRLRLNNVLRGIGSLLDVWPRSSSHCLGSDVLDRSWAQSLRGDWEKVGAALWSSIGVVAAEQGVNVDGPAGGGIAGLASAFIYTHRHSEGDKGREPKPTKPK